MAPSVGEGSPGQLCLCPPALCTLGLRATPGRSRPLKDAIGGAPGKCGQGPRHREAAPGFPVLKQCDPFSRQALSMPGGTAHTLSQPGNLVTCWACFLGMGTTLASPVSAVVPGGLAACSKLPAPSCQSLVGQGGVGTHSWAAGTHAGRQLGRASHRTCCPCPFPCLRSVCPGCLLASWLPPTWLRQLYTRNLGELIPQRALQDKHPRGGSVGQEEAGTQRCYRQARVGFQAHLASD